MEILSITRGRLIILYLLEDSEQEKEGRTGDEQDA